MIVVTQFMRVKGTLSRLISGFVKMILIVFYQTHQFGPCRFISCWNIK